MTSPARLRGARPGGLPERISPQLATLVARPPEGPDWLHEIKYDGYRILLRVTGGRARAHSRRGLDYTDRCASIAAAAPALPLREAFLDGELVVLREDGRTDFQALQNVLGRGDPSRLLYVAFDLLHLDGYDLREVPLVDRKSLLAHRLEDAPPGFRFGRHVQGSGPAFFEEACRLGLEGVVSKRRFACYRSARNRDWLKAKCWRSADAVVGGFTEPEGGRFGFGALLVGGYAPDGRLRYAGKVGTGFSDDTLRTLRARLASLEIESPPFGAGLPRQAARRVRWVRPVLVARVAYGGITDEGFLRHSAFEGLRDDVRAEEVGVPGAE